jgi:hypothetical protein
MDSSTTNMTATTNDDKHTRADTIEQDDQPDAQTNTFINKTINPSIQNPYKKQRTPRNRVNTQLFPTHKNVINQTNNNSTLPPPNSTNHNDNGTDSSSTHYTRSRIPYVNLKRWHSKANHSMETNELRTHSKQRRRSDHNNRTYPSRITH